jgi:hypothetical protein
MSEFAAREQVGSPGQPAQPAGQPGQPAVQPVQPTEQATQPSKLPVQPSKLRVRVTKLLLPSELRRLFTNFAYLVAKQGATAVLGLVYWAVATRLFSARDVGLAAAASSTGFFLGAISALGIPLLLVAELESLPASARHPMSRSRPGKWELNQTGIASGRRRCACAEGRRSPAPAGRP